MGSLFLILMLSTAAAPPATPRFPTMESLKRGETMQSAHLSEAEIVQLQGQLGKTSFDAPASWDKEVRVRRLSLGAVDGLVVKGTELLCGATGNCQIWVFRRVAGRWVNLFPEQAPLASGFGFSEPVKQGIKRLVLSSHTSAEQTDYREYEFDGSLYRNTACHQSSGALDAGAAVKQVLCR
jgi:hypothetical protein